jgi:hypothetical protein
MCTVYQISRLRIFSFSAKDIRKYIGKYRKYCQYALLYLSTQTYVQDYANFSMKSCFCFYIQEASQLFNIYIIFPLDHIHRAGANIQ